MSNKGRRRGSLPLTRGHVHKLLANPIHVGEIVHKGERYPGEYEAIVDRRTGEGVRERLGPNAVARRSGSNAKVPSPPAREIERVVPKGIVDPLGDGLRLNEVLGLAGRRWKATISEAPLQHAQAQTIPGPAFNENRRRGRVRREWNLDRLSSLIRRWPPAIRRPEAPAHPRFVDISSTP